MVVTDLNKKCHCGLSPVILREGYGIAGGDDAGAVSFGGEGGGKRGHPQDG